MWLRQKEKKKNKNILTKKEMGDSQAFVCIEKKSRYRFLLSGLKPAISPKKEKLSTRREEKGEKGERKTTSPR